MYRELNKRIRKFRTTNIKNLSDEELNTLLYDTLMDNNKMSTIVSTGYYNKGQHFYRVRKVNSNLLPLTDFKSESDYWAPPTSVIKEYGRINKPGESILYTATLPKVCLTETNLSENDFYILIRYSAKDIIKTAIICEELSDEPVSFPYQNANTPKVDDWEKAKIINDFMHAEFTKVVGIGSEYLYRVSNMITKHFFDLPPDAQNAWTYPSIHDQNTNNTAFTPSNAKAFLKLDGVMLCNYTKDFPMSVVGVLDGFDKDNHPIVHAPDSDKAKKIFPEIFRNK